jgi:hypothetical protein
VLWQQLKQDLPIGTMLSGNIFARIIYGVLFDAGLGFSVRMEVTDFGSIAEGRNYPHDYPALGSNISGRFAGFDESEHQLVVVGIG